MRGVATHHELDEGIGDGHAHAQPPVGPAGVAVLHHIGRRFRDDQVHLGGRGLGHGREGPWKRGVRALVRCQLRDGDVTELARVLEAVRRSC